MRGKYALGLTNKSGNTTHGLGHTPEYKSWQHMKDRCLNPKCHRYKWYGARGIKICKRWLKFENFYKDMGQKPSRQHTIDRIDNDGNYTLKNCRWATIVEQRNNMRNNHLITYQGKTQNMMQWCKELNMNYYLVRSRQQRGWSPEKTFDRCHYWANKVQERKKEIRNQN